MVKRMSGVERRAQARRDMGSVKGHPKDCQHIFFARLGWAGSYCFAYAQENWTV